MKLSHLWYWLALALVLISYALFIHGYKQHILLGWVDFRSMYTAAWMVRDGAGETLYDISAQWEAFRRYSPSAEPLPFNHPPFEVPLFLPFTYLSFGRAYVTWLALNVLLVGVLAVVLTRVSAAPPGMPTLGVAAACFSFFPTAYMFLQGQDSIFIAIGYTLAYAALRRGREDWAGFLIGLGLYRFQLVLPVVLVFLLRRRWRVVIGFAAACVLLGLVSLGVTGWEGALRYPQFLRELNQSQAYGVIRPENMPNLRGQVMTLVAWRVPTLWIDAGVGLASLASLVWVVRKWKQAETSGAVPFDLLMALTLVVTLLASYHLNLHDLVLLLLPLALVARHLVQTRGSTRPLRRTLEITTIALFLPPVYLIPDWPDKTLVLFCLLVLFAVAIAAEVTTAGKADQKGHEPTGAS
ncbi:MAG TPA: glycosyltransferase family 87 protein [Terriglobales bacterium]|nr:glycosyltransferase family 87 protein [Terriglobales bacterium]